MCSISWFFLQRHKKHENWLKLMSLTSMYHAIAVSPYQNYHISVSIRKSAKPAEFLASGLCNFGETLFNARHWYALYVAQRFLRKNSGNSRISTQTPKRRGIITTWHLLRSPNILRYIVDWSICYPCYMLDLRSK